MSVVAVSVSELVAVVVVPRVVDAPVLPVLAVPAVLAVGSPVLLVLPALGSVAVAVAVAVPVADEAPLVVADPSSPQPARTGARRHEVRSAERFTAQAIARITTECQLSHSHPAAPTWGVLGPMRDEVERT